MENTKDRIIEQAALLFSQKGCKTITMDDIATSMGISKRTIYENFENKNELIQACLNYFFDKQGENVKEILKSSDNIIDAIFEQTNHNSKLLLKIKFDFFDEIRKYFPEAYDNTVKTYKEKQLENSIKMLKKGQRDGVIRKEVKAEVMAVLMHEMGNIVLVSNTFVGYDIDKKEFLATLMYNLTRGMTTEKGLGILNNYVGKYKKNNIR